MTTETATPPATHTRGPWKTTPAGSVVNGDASVRLAQLDTFTYGKDAATIAANAKLIAAAPDLLAALQTIADRRPCWCGTMRDGGRCNSCIAIKAIEHATAIRRAN